MKKIKQLLGITMLSSAFMALFIMTMQEYGAIEALKGWLIAIGHPH